MYRKGSPLPPDCVTQFMNDPQDTQVNNMTFTTPLFILDVNKLGINWNKLTCSHSTQFSFLKRKNIFGARSEGQYQSAEFVFDNSLYKTLAQMLYISIDVK